MERFIGIFSAFFFPQSCLKCGASGNGLCEKCTLAIPFAAIPEHKNTFALYDYENKIVAKAIRNLKYYRKSEAAVALMRRGLPYVSEWIGEIIQSEKQEQFLLVPIPQHKKKNRSRGYNQSMVLARAIEKDLDGARTTALLSKTRFTLPQAHTKNKSERLSNLKSSMTSRKSLEPKSVYILIDDVTTTGATFVEAERALRAAGARKILCIALAHGNTKGK